VLSSRRKPERTSAKPRAVAGATRWVRTVKTLATPIGTAGVAITTLPEEIAISQAEIDLLLHWCGDFLAAPVPERG
jgi:hypothetical protein